MRNEFRNTICQSVRERGVERERGRERERERGARERESKRDCGEKEGESKRWFLQRQKRSE